MQHQVHVIGLNLGVLIQAAPQIFGELMGELSAQSGASHEELMRAGGPDIVAQPIVDLESGKRVGAEALSRFPAEWAKPPDVCFREAFALGLGEDLELLTLTKCGTIAERAIGYLSMNVSPSTMFDPRFPAVMLAMALPDILLEISEGYPVDDYAQLERILRPLRDGGLRIAVDDVGAGFSSLKHIVSIAPDVIKLDRDVVTGGPPGLVHRGDDRRGGPRVRDLAGWLSLGLQDAAQVAAR